MPGDIVTMENNRGSWHVAIINKIEIEDKNIRKYEINKIILIESSSGYQSEWRVMNTTSYKRYYDKGFTLWLKRLDYNY